MSAPRFMDLLALSLAGALLLAAPAARADKGDRAAGGVARGIRGLDSDRTATGALAPWPRHFEDATGDLPNEPVTAVAVDPEDDHVLYAGIDGFLFKSDDSGENWKPILSFPRGLALDEDDDDTNAERARDDGAADPSTAVTRAAADVAAAALEPPLDLSAESLDNPDELPDGDVTEAADVTVFPRETPGVRAIVFVPGSPTVFYVATPRGLWRTANKGGSFERLPIAVGPLGDDVRDVAVDPSRPSRVYAATAAGVIFTRDGGASWRPVVGAAGGEAALCIAVGAGGVNLLAGTVDGLFRSVDGGDNFLEVLLRGLPVSFGVSAVAISPVSGTQYAGTSQGLWVGERGAALLERYEGVGTNLVEAIAPDTTFPRAVVVGTRARGVLWSWDAGNTVDDRAPQVPAAEVTSLSRPASAKKKDAVVVATDRGLFRSADGTGITVTQSGLKKLRELWAKEPSLEDVAYAAVAYKHIDAQRIGELSGRAAFAKIFPSLEASYWIVNGQTIESEQFVLRAGDELPPGIDPSNDNTDLFGNVGAFLITPSVGTQHFFWVQLSWDLDQLVLNDDEIQAARAAPQVWNAQRRTIDRVQEAWAARRRIMTEIAFAPSVRGPQGAKIDAERELRLQELTAQLDAATGGQFSRFGTKENE